MIESLNKSHTGKIVFGIPQGNLARRNATITPLKVISVAKVWGRISESLNANDGEMYHIEDNCFKADCNSGYKLFETEDGAKGYLRHEKQLEEVRAFFRDREQVSVEQIEQVHKILFDKNHQI